MATSTYLASAVVMGALAIGVVALLAHSRATPEYRVPETDSPSALSWVVHDGTAWLLGFALLGAATIGATVLVAGGASAGPFLLAIGAVVAAFLAFGVYSAARSRGHPSSHAVGEAVVTLGALGLVAVVGRLLLTAGI